MTLNTGSFESILAMIVAVLFAVAGMVNLAGLGAAKRDFARWGYPAWFRLLCGALELLSAALLFGQQTRVLGLTLAGAIMIAPASVKPKILVCCPGRSAALSSSRAPQSQRNHAG